MPIATMQFRFSPNGKALITSTLRFKEHRTMLAGLFALTSALTLLPTASSGGVLCPGTPVLAEKVGTDGKLTFGMCGSSNHAHVVSVEGMSMPSAGDLRLKMVSSVEADDRCRINTILRAGGYSLDAFQISLCERSGGHEASIIQFPPAQHIKDLIYGDDGLSGIPCVMKTAASAEHLSNEPKGLSPADVVSAVVRLDQGNWGTLFAEKPTVLMKKYFTAGFNVSWANALSHNQEEPVMDGDPITGWQSVSTVRIKSAEIGASTATTTKVIAHVIVKAEGHVSPEVIIFDLKREDATWKIDDITDANQPSIRTYFRKSYGG